MQPKWSGYSPSLASGSEINGETGPITGSGPSKGISDAREFYKKEQHPTKPKRETLRNRRSKPATNSPRCDLIEAETGVHIYMQRTTRNRERSPRTIY